jgi:hypothetical protein
MKAALALLAAAPLVLTEPAANSGPRDDAPQALAGSQPVCRDRIEQVRQERGLPKLDRQTASPDAPYFIAAVDHRIDGCSVMVMRTDTSDIRPLPANPDSPPEILPARYPPPAR